MSAQAINYSKNKIFIKYLYRHKSKSLACAAQHSMGRLNTPCRYTQGYIRRLRTDFIYLILDKPSVVKCFFLSLACAAQAIKTPVLKLR